MNMNNMNNCVNPVNIKSTKKILEQMSNCICKIKNNQLIGNGFFCKIPLKDNNKITVLMTSYQIINETYFNNNNQIILFMNDYNEQKIIYYNQMRNIYYNKIYNITIIEINDYDNMNMNNFLEIDDDNLFGNNIKTFYENKSIYILHYINNGKASVSYGKINSLLQNNINHMCYIESSSIGGPILNLTNNKVIGLTLFGNQGTIINYPIEDFINRYQNQQQINMMNNFNPNMNINMNMNINNFGIQGLNLGMMNLNIPRIGGIEGLGNIQNMNQGMGGINCMINNLGEEQEKYEDIQIKSIPKKNVVFKTTSGLTTPMVYDYGTTMDEVLKKYWERIGKPENIHSIRFFFLYNANKINYGIKTPVEQYFKFENIPYVIVNDIVVGFTVTPIIIVKFRSTTGSSWDMADYIPDSVDGLLNIFLKQIGKPGLKNDIPSRLCFLYNAKQMKPGDQTTLKNFFKNDKNPKVIVNDMNNLLG